MKTEKQLSTGGLFLDSEKARMVNFREIRAGTIAPRTLYRSSHPVKENRQERTISLLAAETRIAAVLNLADSGAEASVKARFAPWYNRLFNDGRVIALGMEDFMFSGARFHGKLKRALRFMIQNEGPWLVHCYAGVDRTGFVSMVLEAFMGASVDEIAADYLKSFGGVFEPGVYGGSISPGLAAVTEQLALMNDDAAPNEGRGLRDTAERYLRTVIGLSLDETELLRRKLGEEALPA